MLFIFFAMVEDLLNLPMMRWLFINKQYNKIELFLISPDDITGRMFFVALLVADGMFSGEIPLQ
ncbi:hypothetical protein EKP31_10040 [Salmonella enterica]|nr:hypothetical protein [Salmonella enterica]